MQPRHLVLVFTLLILHSTVKAQDRSALPDSQALQIIDKKLNEQFHEIPLGQIAVVGGLQPANPAKGEISPSHFKQLQVWEELGIVTISHAQELTKQFTNWNDFLALSQSGVLARVATTPGSQASVATCSAEQIRTAAIRLDNGITGLLCVTPGSMTVDKIVQNDARTIGTERYRVVMGTLSARPSPLQVEYEKRSGTTMKAQRKFVAILQYDPFSATWALRGYDAIDLDREFSPETQAALRMLGN